MLKRIPISFNPMAYFISISIFVLMFQRELSNVVPLINYYDELVPLVFIVIWLATKKFRIKKSITYFVVYIITLVTVGIVGNVSSGINLSFYPMVVDAYGIFKVFLAMIPLLFILTPKDVNQVVFILAKTLQVYIAVAAIFYVLGSFGIVEGVFKVVRFGIRTYGFVHGNAGDGWLGYYLEACYLVFMMAGSRIKHSRITKIITLALTILTLKGPALLFVALIIANKIFIHRQKIRWYYFVLAGGLGVSVGWWYIQRYLLREGEARRYLNITGLKIARDYFPIGLGFATFGSDMSREFYSQAYYMYGLSNVHGLGGGSTKYITDNYWGMIFGELGVIGGIFTLYLFYCLFKLISDKESVTIETKSAALAMFFSFMAGSLGSAYLTSHLGVICFIVLGIYLNKSFSNASKDRDKTSLIY